MIHIIQKLIYNKFCRDCGKWLWFKKIYNGKNLIIYYVKNAMIGIKKPLMYINY